MSIAIVMQTAAIYRFLVWPQPEDRGSMIWIWRLTAIAATVVAATLIVLAIDNVAHPFAVVVREKRADGSIKQTVLPWMASIPMLIIGIVLLAFGVLLLFR